MKKIVKFVIILVAVLGIMFAEYRFIMLNIKPYRGECGTVYLEIFNQVDEYYADKWEHRNLVPIKYYVEE